MTDYALRSDLIHSIQDALGRTHLSEEDLCNDLIDSIEPTIRADEQAKIALEIASRQKVQEWEAKIRADERERLREQVGALECSLVWNYGGDVLIFRSQVLNLLGGESDG